MPITPNLTGYVRRLPTGQRWLQRSIRLRENRPSSQLIRVYIGALSSAIAITILVSNGYSVHLTANGARNAQSTAIKTGCRFVKDNVVLEGGEAISCIVIISMDIHGDLQMDNGAHNDRIGEPEDTLPVRLTEDKDETLSPGAGTDTMREQGRQFA